MRDKKLLTSFVVVVVDSNAVLISEQSPLLLLQRAEVTEFIGKVLTEGNEATSALLHSLAHFLREEEDKILRSQKEQKGTVVLTCARCGVVLVMFIQHFACFCCLGLKKVDILTQGGSKDHNSDSG